MEYALLGSTGVKVSRICVGTATFGVAPSERDADRIVHAALDLGINFFDTADVYGNTPIFDRSDWRVWAILVATVLDGRYSMVRFRPFAYPAADSIDLALDTLYGYGS